MKDPRQQYVYKENRFKKLRFKFFSLLRDIWHEFYYPIKKRWQEYFKTHKSHKGRIIGITYLFGAIIFLITVTAIVYKQTEIDKGYKDQLIRMQAMNTELRILKSEVKIVEVEKYVPVVIKSKETVTKYLITFNKDYSFEYTPNEYFTIDEIYMMAKTLYGEARGASKEQQAGVIWLLCNRYDYGTEHPKNNFGTTFEEIITRKDQFAGFSWNHPTDENCLKMVNDVLNRWLKEKEIKSDNPEVSEKGLGEMVGRILPKRYIYFVAKGDGLRNVFFVSWGDKNKSEKHWGWNWTSPYAG